MSQPPGYISSLARALASNTVYEGVWVFMMMTRTRTKRKKEIFCRFCRSGSVVYHCPFVLRVYD